MSAPRNVTATKAGLTRRVAELSKQVASLVIERDKLRYLMLVFCPELQPGQLMPRESPNARLEYLLSHVDHQAAVRELITTATRSAAS